MVRRSLAAALALGAAATALAVPTGTAQAVPPGTKDVTAVLFEWTFASVAKACTDTLGPAGYGYVQVSPPQEHIQGGQWWTSYQPVSYRIAGRLGDRAAFSAMIGTCHAAGVKVVADSVINHMAAGDGTGTGGSRTPSTPTPASTRAPTWTTAGGRSTTTRTGRTSRTANWSASPTSTPVSRTYAAGSRRT